MIGWTSAVRTPCGQPLGRRDQSMPNCVSLGRPLGGRPRGSPRTSMGWDMTHRGRHRSYQGRPRTPRGRPNCPADVHGTVDALWTQQGGSTTTSFVNYRNWPRYGLHWSGWYCYPAQRVLCRIAVPTTTAQTVYVVNFYPTTITILYNERKTCVFDVLYHCSSPSAFAYRCMTTGQLVAS